MISVGGNLSGAAQWPSCRAHVGAMISVVFCVLVQPMLCESGWGVWGWGGGRAGEGISGAGAVSGIAR